jgi:SAM-dependent methyltransferase
MSAPGLRLPTAGTLHDELVLERRATVLARWFGTLIPPAAQVLDVGCGDGLIAALIASHRPDVRIEGVDVLVREGTRIPVSPFDGTRLPFPDDSFDLVLFSDVLHHTVDPRVLQAEASRVTRRHVLIKDHNVKGILARQRLRFMDHVGNARFNVALPHTYWSEGQWTSAWQALGLHPERMITQLGLYPGLADRIFGAQLHFIALLARPLGAS